MKKLFEEKKEKEKECYDQHAKDLIDLKIGDKIITKINIEAKEWVPGTVINLANRPRSYVIKLDVNNNIIERNRGHIKKGTNGVKKSNSLSVYYDDDHSPKEVSSNINPQELEKIDSDQGIINIQGSDMEHAHEPIIVKTRVGRVSHRPSYLNDYALSSSSSSEEERC